MPALGERRNCVGTFSYNWHDSLCCDSSGVLWLLAVSNGLKVGELAMHEVDHGGEVAG